MAKFQLLAGSHSHGGRVWDATAQDKPIIETDIDLVAWLGPEKFLRVNDDVPASKGRATTNPEASKAPRAAPMSEGYQQPRGAKAPKAAKASKAAQAVEDDDEDEDEDDSVESELGEDVTDEYPNAKEKRLRVFKNRGFFYPASEDDPNESVSEKALRKKDLKKFLRDYDPDAEEEDEDDEE
jgi:hypothetical protein